MSYHTFAIRIAGAGAGRLELSVIDSPAGEASDTVGRIVDPEKLELLRGRLGALRHMGAVPEPVRGDAGEHFTTRQLLETVGAELFRGLIPEGIRPVWDQSRGWAARNDERLRVEIHVDPTAEDVWEVAGLPWELVFQGATGAFWGLDPRNTIVRYLDLGVPPRRIRLGRPLRVVVAGARPRELASLDLDREADELVTAWGESSGIDIVRLDRATPRRLRTCLTVTRPHVLHFMGHGYSDPSSGWGGLVLETEAGDHRKVGGSDLSDLFRGFSDLALLVLNACDTAKMGSRFQPFAGAAAGLARASVPAIVAMQYPISDRAAIAFSAALARNLAAGRGVDEAVVEGRMAIHQDNHDSLEWITPTLFMRGGEVEAERYDQPAARPGTAVASLERPTKITQTTNVTGDVGNIVNAETVGTIDLRSGD